MRQYFAAFIALLFNIFYGICEGFSSILLTQLESKNSTIPVTSEEASWIASIFLLPGPIGSFSVGILMEIYGRRRIAQFSYVPMFLGWAIISRSDTVLFICIGRLITGFAAGMEPAVIVYISEIVIPPSHRSAVLSLQTPAVCVGASLNYFLGYVFHWQNEALFFSFMAAICFVLMFALPETPFWLLSKGNIREATTSMEWLMNNSANVEEELSKLTSTIKCSKEEDTRKLNSKEDGTSFLALVIATRAWMPFFIMVILVFLQQSTGYKMQLYYAINFYESFGANIDSYLSSMIFTILTVISACLLTAVINLFNRKTLMIVSASGVCASCAVSAVYLNFFSHIRSPQPHPSAISWLPVVCMWACVVFNTIGLNSLTWVMAGELFPQKVRGTMVGLIWVVGFISMFASVKIYPFLVSVLQIRGILAMFAGFAFITVLFCSTILPETKGKTFLEIEQLWLPKPKKEHSNC